MISPSIPPPPPPPPPNRAWIIYYAYFVIHAYIKLVTIIMDSQHLTPLSCRICYYFVVVVFCRVQGENLYRQRAVTSPNTSTYAWIVKSYCRIEAAAVH